MSAKLSKVATEILASMRQNPEADFLPLSQCDETVAARLVSLGLLTYGSGRESDYFGLPSPTYLLTESGRSRGLGAARQQSHARCYVGCEHDPGEGHNPVTGHASND